MLESQFENFSMITVEKWLKNHHFLNEMIKYEKNFNEHSKKLLQIIISLNDIIKYEKQQRY